MAKNTQNNQLPN